jgi:hypothetical protein
LSQSVETVTRSSRVDIVGGDVDELDPPEDLDEFAEQAKTTGPVRKDLRQFVNDVWEPGYDVVAESEQTVAYFMGEDAIDGNVSLPEGVEQPEGGFLANSGVYAGEQHQDFYDFGKETTWQRWVRGTILIELLKADKDDPESQITGFYHIRPETVYPQVYNNSNILIDPEDTDEDGVELTRRDEAAAYIQFDDESILGLRRNGFDEQQVPLSQNDVIKQVLEPDIGNEASRFKANEQGVFGTSIIEGISDDIAEYKQIKRDRAKAISTKAYGIWKASFGRETLDLGDTTEIIEWDETDQDDFTNEVGSLEPGDIVTHDGTIDFEKFESEVPELNEVIQQYINIMLAPLPAPKYMIGFAEGINRDISTEQKEAYHDLVSEERRYQEKQWTKALKTVAERIGLDTEGLQLRIRPEQSSSPVERWDAEEVQKFADYTSALNAAAGPMGGPATIIDIEEYLTEIAQLPDDVAGSVEEMPPMEETPEDQEAMLELFEEEALATRFSEGDVVMSPQGTGVIVGVWEESW